MSRLRHFQTPRLSIIGASASDYAVLMEGNSLNSKLGQKIVTWVRVWPHEPKG
jgi:hypothetical protein